MITATAYGERAKACATEGRFDAAEAVLREGLGHWPEHPILRYALAVLLLARGAHQEGWALYESRWALPGGPRQVAFSFPRWTGQPVKRLVLLPEQGAGDQIMFARYVPLLVARGVAVTLLCPPELVRLFAPLGATLISVDGQVDIPAADAWCYMGSLPGLVGTIPDAPYLPGGGAGSGVGVMLEGRTQGRLPSPLFETLAARGRSLHPADTGAHDFEDTAEIIRGLERVISVDTSVAHLAGAMGKPVTLLLPHSPDWRWGRSGERSAWYPSARLYRQSAPGDWRDVARALAL